MTTDTSGNTKMSIEQKAKAYELALEAARKELGVDRKEWEVVQQVLHNIFPELRESEDERIRKRLLWFLAHYEGRWDYPEKRMACRAWLERQKDASKAIEAVDRIDKYIDEHLANAHDMKDSNPDKKYYRGWDDALGEMAGILQDVYSEEKQKEQKQKMPPKWLYRLEFKDGSCGLWYDGNGKWCFESGIGSIEGCKTKTLPMEYDERYKQDGRDWFSSCSRKEDLMHWYSLQDAEKLISKGFVFTRYLATEYHEYDQQTVFIKETSLYREEIDIFELFKKDAECIEDSVKFEEGFKTGRESGLRDGQKYVLDNAESYGLCKPAEWSDEDEKRFNRVLQLIEHFDDLAHEPTFAGPKWTHPYTKEIHWLKSLRPSWKPSEQDELMKLKYAGTSTKLD